MDSAELDITDQDGVACCQVLLVAATHGDALAQAMILHNRIIARTEGRVYVRARALQGPKACVELFVLTTDLRRWRAVITDALERSI